MRNKLSAALLAVLYSGGGALFGCAMNQPQMPSSAAPQPTPEQLAAEAAEQQQRQANEIQRLKDIATKAEERKKAADEAQKKQQAEALEDYHREVARQAEVTQLLSKLSIFGYARTGYGMTVYSNQRCMVPPADGGNDWWKRGAIVYGNGRAEMTCWYREYSKAFGQDTVTVCMATHGSDGKWHVLGRCMYVGADRVLRGNPIPERAF